MKTQSHQYGFIYQDSASLHHHEYLMKPILEMVSQLTSGIAPNNNKPRILDIGCGNGSLTYLLAQAGYEVVGAEQSESGVELAQKSYPECHFVRADIYNFPVDDFRHQFDIIIAAEVIEHLFSPRELLRVAKLCLKPTGSIILTTPYHGYLKNLVMALFDKMDQHYTTLWDGGHIKFFSVATMTSILEQEGYENIQFKFAGRYPFLWKTMLCSSTLTQVKNHQVND